MAFCFVNFYEGIKKQASDEAYADQKTYAKGHLLPAETYSFTDAYMLSPTLTLFHRLEHLTVASGLSMKGR